MSKINNKLSRLYASTGEVFEHRIDVICTNIRRTTLESFISAPVLQGESAEQILTTIYDLAYRNQQLLAAGSSLSLQAKEDYLLRVNDTLAGAVTTIHEVYVDHLDRQSLEFRLAVTTALHIPVVGK